MPLFMQVRTVGGDLAADEAAEALAGEFAADGRFGVTCLRCWVSEPAGKIFCLIEAEDLDLLAALRRRGLRAIAEETYPVSEHCGLRPGTDRSQLSRASPGEDRTAFGNSDLSRRK